MLEFLKSYTSAVSLDLPQYVHRFPQNKDKADFLLFANQVICEIKDKRCVDMPRQVERVWQKGSLAPEHAARDVSRPIIKDLHDAARQIRDTREVLGLPDACGLVILESHVPETLSSAVFIAAANSELQVGLPEIDCVLCLDLVNAFSRSETDLMRLAQLVCRPGKRSEKLSDLVEAPLLADFSKQVGIPLRPGYLVEKLHQTWVTDQTGKFLKYEARVDLVTHNPKSAILHTILYLAGKWLWAVGLAWAIVYWLCHQSNSN